MKTAIKHQKLRQGGQTPSASTAPTIPAKVAASRATARVRPSSGKKRFTLSDDASNGLQRLRENSLEKLPNCRVKTWGNLAHRIGCSTSKIQFWRDGRLRINQDDAITLALLDDTLFFDPAERAKWWLDANGYQKDAAWIKKQVSDRTDLLPHIDIALGKLGEFAKMKRLPASDFNMALSCFLAQRRLGEEIAGWLRGGNGMGTTAFFWRWHKDLGARLMVPQTIQFVKNQIAPGEDIRRAWASTGTPSQLKVFLFFQINEDSDEQEAAEKDLSGTLKSFRSKLDLDANAASRFVVHTTRERFVHAADCFVFVSPNQSFGVLVSESNKLMRVVLGSGAEEMSSRPWDWCGQIIQIEGEETIERECLKPRKVFLNRSYGRLDPMAETQTPPGPWKILEA